MKCKKACVNSRPSINWLVVLGGEGQKNGRFAPHIFLTQQTYWLKITMSFQCRLQFRINLANVFNQPLRSHIINVHQQRP